MANGVNGISGDASNLCHCNFSVSAAQESCYGNGTLGYKECSARCNTELRNKMVRLLRQRFKVCLIVVRPCQRYECTLYSK